ncbi:hypothetical protein JMJ35_000995 [Cladonia borealis]|uniref:NACHT-NTPase and P-loop NTPases N-terminal domain-containing protein n=1 Tax=Cladonia borealis TaxID=184061 RepID=A0AA39R7M4_9LECA|nr:hypothetical protein JMJ35_000995 [Cladonia borealis]
MSGAEALAVIGIIASILQLVDFSSKAFSRVKEYGEDAQDIPKTFRDIESGLPLIVHMLGEIQTRVSDGQVPEKGCKALGGVLGDCKAKLAELDIIFDKVLPQDGDSKARRAWKGLVSLRQDKIVEEISQALSRSLQSLTLFHVVAAPTTRQIQALVENISKKDLTPSPASAVQTYFAVPTLSSNEFVGREETMADLASKLCLPATHCRVAVVGLGGVGKTRVALQLAQKYRRSANISVFWVYAYNAERLRKAFDEIARRVNIPGHQDPGADTLRLVKEWFESDASGQWLLIVDNVDDAELLYPSRPHCIRYADYLPRSEAGSILLTTRNGKVGREFAAVHNVLTLASMNAEESMSLLSTRLGAYRSEESLKELTEELSRIPLALVQAASFITQNEMTVEGYLQLYRQSDSTKIQLLSDNFEDEERDALSKNPIATTWSVSFEYIRKDEPQTADLLSFISMLANEGVPEFLLPHGTEPIKFEKAIGTLHAFSFISTRYVELQDSRHRLFDFHRLVRVAMRNWLTINGAFDHWTAYVIEELAIVGERPDLKKYDFGSQFVPHATELLALERLQGFSGPQDVPAIFRKYKGKKRFTLLHQEAKEECMHKDSICPRCTERILHCVASLLYNVADYASSISFRERSLAICTHLYGDSHSRSLGSLFRLVKANKRLSELETALLTSRASSLMTSSRRGQSKEAIAEILCRKLIKNSRPKSVPVGEYTLRGMMELARILRVSMKYAEADAVERQLTAICHRDMDQTHSDINLKRLIALAEVLYTRREYDEAAEYQLRVLDGYESSRGLQGIDTINTLNKLALTYFFLSRYEEAEKYQRLAFDSQKTLRGLGDRFTIDYMLTLSRFLRWQSKIMEADDLAESALSISAKTFGEPSPTYLRHLRGHQEYLLGYRLSLWDPSLGRTAGE